MINVIQGGTRTTLQDAGRPGLRHLGIPECGAADKLNFALANYLVGNPWSTTAMECALGGLHLRFTQDTTIALTGAEMWAQINGQNTPYYKALPVKKGDILTLSFAREGCRAYIAVAGGIAASDFMGSSATYTPAKLGGIDGTPLQTGQSLQSAERETSGIKTLPVGYKPRLSRHVVLRANKGPEFEQVSDNGRRYLFTCPFIASSDTNRMGSRLRGDKIEFDHDISMTSSPLLPGTLQVPPDGQPILTLIDSHCTGGYPRVLQIIQADLWQLGQIAPGSQISFRRVFEGESATILSHRNAYYSAIMDGFAF